jgi:hypothetical protein
MSELGPWGAHRMGFSMLEITVLIKAGKVGALPIPQVKKHTCEGLVSKL